ncbi:MAG: ferredoxin-type protein NapF [Gammaproteobacteria bacterium]|nr:MAG: ferredoxin-type protein NapF [Gammaproteobacteria bacterium]
MGQVDFSRRALLRGGRDAGLPFPPWALNDFTDRCERCDACIAACETDILMRGDGGFPRVDFRRGECTFCGACAAVCEHGAFSATEGSPWSLRVALAGTCLAEQGVSCRSCEDVCEPRALCFRLQVGGRAALQMDIDRCNGCGACISVCPPGVLHMEEFE